MPTRPQIPRAEETWFSRCQQGCRRQGAAIGCWVVDNGESSPRVLYTQSCPRTGSSTSVSVLLPNTGLNHCSLSLVSFADPQSYPHAHRHVCPDGTHTHARTYAHTCACTHMHTHTRAHTHARTHTHTHHSFLCPLLFQFP